MSNWPRGHADFSSSNWTARTPSKPRDTSWHPIDRGNRFSLPSWLGSSAFVLFVILGVIPLVGLLLGFFGA